MIDLPKGSIILGVQQKRLVDRIFSPFREFAKAEASSGVLLLLCILIALVWANSPWHASYEHVLEIPLGISAGGFSFIHSLEWWINDFLMAIFFLAVGLEIKRELIVGQLSSFKQASLPVAAAIGGMIIPAVIFLLFTAGSPASRGWGIPMATDIAFSLGVLALAGRAVSRRFGVFLSAFAIADDIGAVLVIAIFYTATLNYFALLGAMVVLVILLIFNSLGIRNFWFYSIPGILLWLFTYQSGIHATVAGVLLAFCIPAKSLINSREFVEEAEFMIRGFKETGMIGEDIHPTDEQIQAVQGLELACRSADTPLFRLEHALVPFVSFFIIPLFALANAGVHITADMSGYITNPIVLGIVAGLILGKQLGVTGFSYLAVKLKISSLPQGTKWLDIYSLSWLGAIGFTMSLFVTSLAYHGNGEYIGAAKIGILIASAIAGLIGFILLKRRAKAIEAASS